MVVLVDRNNYKVLLEDVDLPGPALDPVVSPGDGVLPGLDGRGLLREPREPEGGEDVHSEQSVRELRGIGATLTCLCPPG